MAFNKEDLYGRNAVINPLAHKMDAMGGYREPFTDIQDNLTPISIVNQQSKREVTFGAFGNDYQQPLGFGNNRKPMNYHYQQQVPSQPQQYTRGGPISQTQEASNVNRNPILGGSSAYEYQPRHQSVGPGHKAASAIPDIRDRKMREREERIRREKEEMETLSQQYPFGRNNQGGAGAPLRDREGNIVSNRRPYSQVREPPTKMQSSHSNQNLNYYQQQIATPPNLNQSVDVSLGYANYYQQANAQASKSPLAGQAPSTKITNLETNEQLQMLEKKAKEEEMKRKRKEEELREELKIKEEIEREKQQQIQEKMKKEQQQNKFTSQGMSEPQHVVRGGRGSLKVQNSPSLYSAKGSDLNGGVSDVDSSMFKAESRRQLDMNQFSSSFNRQQAPSMPNTNSLINSNNTQVFSQMESNFNSELHKLKSEMAMQQQQFENQLAQLRFEAQKNIDYRVKAEQELQRMKLNSQRESQRPSSNGISSQRDGGVRRSMAGINNYEKLFFGGNQGSQGYPGIGMQSSIPLINNNRAPMNANINYDQSNQGLGGKFEGSLSLKAESAFVPLNQVLPMPSGYQDPSAYLNDFSLDQVALHNRQSQLHVTQQSKPQIPKKQDHYEGQDISLHQLETAINEISEMNLGENFKHTQQVLEAARSLPQQPPYHDQQPSGPSIPEYRGIQADDEEMSHLAYQLSQANSVQAQSKQQENVDLKKEYLMRNIPMNPIEESSNEHTFPSLTKFSEMQTKN